jgi:hypothetical protein
MKRDSLRSIVRLVQVLLIAGLAACGGGDDEGPDGGGNGGGGLSFDGTELALGRAGLLPDLAATAQGDLHLCYRGDPVRGEHGVYYQFYRASARSWTAAVRLDDGSHPLANGLEFGSPRVAAGPAGEATVVWAESPGPGNNVWAREIGADGTPTGAFHRVHAERGIAVEQHDLVIDPSGAVHLVFGLIGQGQDGVYHKTRPAGGAWSDIAQRRRVFSAGRKHPVIEAQRSAGGAVRLWAAWRFRDLEYVGFDGSAWGEALRIPAPQNRSIGDPAIALRPDGQPVIATAPFEQGVSNRSFYVHQPASAEPLLQIDPVTLSSSGVVGIGFGASGRGIVVWDRFVLGARPDRSIISLVTSLDTTRDTILNRRRLCYKLTDSGGRFPPIPDGDNSNAYVLPLEAQPLGEQSDPAVAVHDDTVDLVYLDTRAAPQLQLFHRRARLP